MYVSQRCSLRRGRLTAPTVGARRQRWEADRSAICTQLALSQPRSLFDNCTAQTYAGTRLLTRRQRTDLQNKMARRFALASFKALALRKSNSGLVIVRALRTEERPQTVNKFILFLSTALSAFECPQAAVSSKHSLAPWPPHRPHQTRARRSRRLV